MLPYIDLDNYDITEELLGGGSDNLTITLTKSIKEYDYFNIFLKYDNGGVGIQCCSVIPSKELQLLLKLNRLDHSYFLGTGIRYDGSWRTTTIGITLIDEYKFILKSNVTPCIYESSVYGITLTPKINQKQFRRVK